MTSNPDFRARAKTIAAVTTQLTAIVPKLTAQEFLCLLEAMVQARRAALSTWDALPGSGPPSST